MSPHSIHRRSSIARPLEPSYATNKAVLRLMPSAALLSAAVWWLSGSSAPALTTIATAIGIVFGAWALARELAPDHNAVAFVSMALAYGVTFFVPAASLLLVFVALALVRIVNRSVGLPARPLDSLIVTSLAMWAAYSHGNPWLACCAALAFVCDALAPGGQKRQLLFALACLGASVSIALEARAEAPLVTHSLATQAGLLAVTGVFLFSTARAGAPQSLGDATGEPLSGRRVQLGALVGWCVALSSSLPPEESIERAAFVWAVLAGVSLAGLRFTR